MNDIHETLLNNYEEAMDMGMSPSEAMEWAKEKTHGYLINGISIGKDKYAYKSDKN